MGSKTGFGWDDTLRTTKSMPHHITMHYKTSNRI